MKKLCTIFFISAVLLSLYGCGTSAQKDTEYSHAHTDITATPLEENCKECNQVAYHTYRHPFSGKAQFYCVAHYKQLIDMMNKVFAD
ncbi:MAG: hypothetical protein IIW54_08695 [Lachnospiraceae bacterium]|nr:hypothetical protein [Lachnospiraceae bacterium]